MKVHDLTHEIVTTSAIFGREKNISVVFEGTGAATNGTEIILPSLPVGATISDDNAKILRGYVDHEAGHLRHTDIKAANKLGDTPLFRVWNSIEDIWMERKVMDEYVGAEKNLRATAEAVSARELDFLKKNPEVLKEVNAQTIGTSIIKRGKMGYTGENSKAVFDLLPENLQEWSDAWVKAIDKCESTQDCISLARKIEELIEQDPELESSPEDFKFEPGEGGDGEQEAEPQEGEGEGKGKGKGDGKLEDGDEAFDEAGDIKQAIENMAATGEGLNFDVPGGVKAQYNVMSTRFDKTYTRHNKNDYVTDWRVKEMRQAKISDYDSVINRVSGTVNVMRAKLRRALLSKENRDWDFGRQQGRLDTKRLTSAYNGAESVYKMRKDRDEFDTAVHMLVDLSGSMAGEKMSVAGAAAIAFCECLEGSGIKFQVSGFDNSGSTEEHMKMYRKAHASGKVYHRYEPLNTIIYKSFDERLQEAKPALSVLPHSAGGNNSDADAVLWAYNQLKDRPQKRKVLIVLSDGQPANDGINIDWSRSSSILMGALKSSIQEVSKSVECVGIGICTDHVKTIYPNSVSIKQVSDLSGVVFNKLSEILLGGKVKL